MRRCLLVLPLTNLCSLVVNPTRVFLPDFTPVLFFFFFFFCHILVLEAKDLDAKDEDGKM